MQDYLLKFLFSKAKSSIFQLENQTTRSDKGNHSQKVPVFKMGKSEEKKNLGLIYYMLLTYVL
ncbi:hypothetical protein BVRB_8g187550 [Beta vulgaris subsp. vulgaris]|nr:hypothetical protein BVRB_8g187550 [Beta vulgaris subsp. vulgaris]